jgi:iron(III) transport system substrate-binding protein
VAGSVVWMSSVRRWGIGAVLGAVALSGCGGSSGGGAARARGNGSITVYSGQHEQTMSRLAADFTRRTGIKVQLRSSDEASLANQILREGSGSPADVFVAENPPALTVLEHRGLLATVDPATLANVPARFNAPKGDWVALSARSAVLAFNTKQVEDAQLPTTLLDLAKPAWKGRVGFAPTETDFQPLITAVQALDGQPAATSWLQWLKDNAKVYDDNEALIAAVNRGEVATGLVDHYYWYRLRDEVGAAKTDSALHYFAGGDPGALVDVSGAAALRSSAHAAEAQRFLAYLVSKPAQEIVATSESYEYPLGSGVTTKRPLRPFSRLRPPHLTVEQLGDGRSALQALQQVGLL